MGVGRNGENILSVFTRRTLSQERIVAREQGEVLALVLPQHPVKGEACVRTLMADPPSTKPGRADRLAKLRNPVQVCIVFCMFDLSDIYQYRNGVRV